MILNMLSNKQTRGIGEQRILIYIHPFEGRGVAPFIIPFMPMRDESNIQVALRMGLKCVARMYGCHVRTCKVCNTFDSTGLLQPMFDYLPLFLEESIHPSVSSSIRYHFYLHYS